MILKLSENINSSLLNTLEVHADNKYVFSEADLFQNPKPNKTDRADQTIVSKKKKSKS